LVPAVTQVEDALPTERDTRDLSGLIPESWLCIDCGFNTAPALLNRRDAEKAIKALGFAWDMGAGVEQHINSDSEVYTVLRKVWKKAGVEEMGGCLCIGCLEKRIGRKLKPKDFLRDHSFNNLPGTRRLLQRRGDR
jgi:hypothetical protein